MKILPQTLTAVLILSAGVTAQAQTAAPQPTPLVNAYGEPAGFGDLPQVPVPATQDERFSASRPGAGGLYLFPGYRGRLHGESLGAWQARAAAMNNGTVTIGALEVLDSGPTGPLSPEAQAAARAEVTAEVLGRINATDRIMSGLKSRAKDLDPEARARFKSAASDVAERRQALREDLKTVRMADEAQWHSARSEVAVSFNAYVQSMHQAEATVGAQGQPNA